MARVPWWGVQEGQDPTAPANRVKFGIRYIKAYRNRDPGTWAWETRTVDVEAHGIYFQIDSPISTEVCLAGRSTRFGVGKLLMYNIDKVPASTAREAVETLECGGETITYSQPPALIPLWQGKGRIAQSYDGNQHDKDDWGAVPLMWAILDAAGVQNNVVHVDYNNHLGATTPSWESNMTESVQIGATYFGFTNTRIYDDQKELTAAITSLKNECDKSTADDPLFIIAAGPMETIYRAIVESQSTKRNHIHVISHSKWNNEHYHTPNIHTRADIENLGINWHQIPDQNSGFFHTSFEEYNFLNNSAPKYVWIYDRLEASGKPDASDAGIAYWVVTGDPFGTVSKVREFIGL